ncbi:hypothetical protein B0H12DRAFT_1082508 [Mycena haematopus]|nr:hypothetical protein B0H12DRAFT_1082508 [Mycena haematopus]
MWQPIAIWLFPDVDPGSPYLETDVLNCLQQSAELAKKASSLPHHPVDPPSYPEPRVVSRADFDSLSARFDFLSADQISLQAQISDTIFDTIKIQNKSDKLRKNYCRNKTNIRRIILPISSPIVLKAGLTTLSLALLLISIRKNPAACARSLILFHKLRWIHLDHIPPQGAPAGITWAPVSFASPTPPGTAGATPAVVRALLAARSHALVARIARIGGACFGAAKMPDFVIALGLGARAHQQRALQRREVLVKYTKAWRRQYSTAACSCSAPAPPGAILQQRQLGLGSGGGSHPLGVVTQYMEFGYRGAQGNKKGWGRLLGGVS